MKSEAVLKSTVLGGGGSVSVGSAHRVCYPSKKGGKPYIDPNGKRYIEFRSGADVWRMDITKEQARRLALGLWELSRTG